MNLREHYPAILGSCVALFAACAFAQAPATNTTTPPPSATAPAATAAGSAEVQPAQSTTTASNKPRQTKKHKAAHSTRPTDSMTRAPDDPYRTALRRCVEGQASQRDRCLDDAIARYGRS